MREPVQRRIKKGIVFVLTAACGLMLSGCHRSSRPAPVQATGFCCEITAVSGDLTVQGTLSRPNAAQLSLVLTKPETLSGLKLDWNGTELSAQWHGLSVPLDQARLPDTSLMEGLIAGLDAALGAAETGRLTEEGTVIEGEIGAHAFRLLADPTTGQLRTLQIPDWKLTVTFEKRQEP